MNRVWKTVCSAVFSLGLLPFPDLSETSDALGEDLGMSAMLKVPSPIDLIKE